MAKADLGEKHVCPECGSKFYDLTKRPAVCPMCQFSFNPDELDADTTVPVEPLTPEVQDDEDETAAASPVDEEDVDEEEQEAKELELDGDDAAIISGSTDDEDSERPDFDGFNTDEDEDEDAALVDDDEDETLPPTGNADGDDAEEVEI